MNHSLLIFIFGVLFCSATCAGTYTGKVEKIDLHADNWQNYNPDDQGFLSLYIEGMPKSCHADRGLNRVVITTDHPLFQGVLSTALAAKASGRKLTVHYLDKCTVRTGAWDFGYISLRE